MNKEMIISVNAYEKRVAILEDGVVVEFYVERADESKAVVGNIYKGKVRKVLPGMQSAFVDIGLERDAFLYVGDFFEETEEDLDTAESVARPRPERSERAERPIEPPRRESGREPDGKRTGRERRPEPSVVERPVALDPTDTVTADAERESDTVTTALPTPYTASDVESDIESVGEERAEPVTESAIATPLLMSLLEQGGESKFERVSDDWEDAPASQDAPRVPEHQRLPEHQRETPADSHTSATDDSLEIERDALGEESEPAPARDRRRGRRKEVIGEEKKKPSRRRGKKTDEDVALLSATDEPSASPSAADAHFERVLDEDYGEEAGDFLKDALIQQKIIAQTRIDEIATKPEAPAPIPPVTDVDDTPAVEPLTLGYERIADDQPDDLASDEVVEAVPHPPAEAAVGTPVEDVDGLTETSDAEPVETESSATPKPEHKEPEHEENANQRSEPESADEVVAASTDDDPLPDTAQLQVRPPQAEFPPRRGRRSRRRGGRNANASGDEASDTDDRSDSPDDETPERVALESDVATEADTGGAVENVRDVVASEEPAIVVREISVNPESLALIETPTTPDPRPESRTPAPRDGRPAARHGREERRDEPRRDEPRKEERRDLDVPRRQPVITELLREGQEIIVQIAKEPIGLKGARITSYVSLPGRYLVYLPTISHIGVSRKISTEQERLRLKRTLTMLREREGITGGFIVRTACEGRSEQDLCDDMLYLARTWRDIRRRADQARSGTVLCRELDLVQRLLRDHMSSDFSVIRVDDAAEYANIVEFINRFQPKLVDRVRLYTRSRPIFEEYNIQPEIEAALKPRVWLRSGGFIVINQTEALVAIDVNTGKFVGKSNRLEDTITRTNLEAAAEIVRQIRLRDLGGIIVLDFIDMEDRRNRQKVMQVLEQAMKSDRSPSKITAFNDFGLVAITRKRVRQSLERILSEPCHYCGGSGMIKSTQTMCYEILSDAKHLAKEKAASGQVVSEVTLRVSPQVAEALRGTEQRVLREIEMNFGTPVTLHSDPNIHQERFDFAFI
ncbi:Rne/Rng family ribonuclease [Chloracidobacterium validum]|uniref:Rne/Rng family ribonuclease n=1 Tax=Chloracidobacterium validum TaxID=2821543 RepID=A0ABX8BDH3_9BACT|nr:Rne/Rng family ribonuclease [Chloracidobacterium validum]QUW03120.1 Rne/Rng family ribonuclease [Chloracidobacterium validum]